MLLYVKSNVQSYVNICFIMLYVFATYVNICEHMLTYVQRTCFFMIFYVNICFMNICFKNIPARLKIIKKHTKHMFGKHMFFLLIIKKHMFTKHMKIFGVRKKIR